jgi:glutamine synthetase adenylyltransferase
VAGDLALGKELVVRAEPFVYADTIDPDSVREIRTMNARSEDLLRRKGSHEREV